MINNIYIRIHTKGQDVKSNKLMSTSIYLCNNPEVESSRPSFYPPQPMQSQDFDYITCVIAVINFYMKMVALPKSHHYLIYKNSAFGFIQKYKRPRITPLQQHWHNNRAIDPDFDVSLLTTWRSEN